ncbi:hypothetical protein SH661x_002936 [Planctomicrobium sp. SH661]|uniref:hypothetical protein n=1 Tax=Planctomicrobium sp. SH661 TaxID=3448124 RepID=UPI003F5C8092
MRFPKVAIPRQLSYQACICLVILNVGCIPWGQPAGKPTLEETLLAEAPAALAQSARTTGDPQRGALVFHSPLLACSKCHRTGQETTGIPQLGPDLTQYDAKLSDEEIVKAVLTPSSSIRRGWETVVVATDDGRTFTGLVDEETDESISLRDLQTSHVTKIPLSEIDERKNSDVSIMPPGQVNLLEDRESFLDLITYLIAIRDGGKERARELQPSAE